MSDHGVRISVAYLGTSLFEKSVVCLVNAVPEIVSRLGRCRLLDKRVLKVCLSADSRPSNEIVISTHKLLDQSISFQIFEQCYCVACISRISLLSMCDSNDKA